MKNLKRLLAVLCCLGVLMGISRWIDARHPLRTSAGSARPGLAAAHPSNAAPLLSVESIQKQVAAQQANAADPGRASAASEPVFKAFGDWADLYLATTEPVGRAALLEEGKRLAKARRDLLAETIRQDPKGALDQAAPYRWRQGMPADIAVFLEENVQGRAKFEVFCAMPVPGKDHRDFTGSTLRYVTLGTKTYKAYVYGRRSTQITQQDAAVYGIAIGDAMAVHEDPMRVLDSDEAQAGQASGKVPSSGTCLVCGQSATAASGMLLADYAGKVIPICGVSHASELNTSLVEAEAKRAVRLNSAGTNTVPATPVWSYGTKTLLFIRVVFPDDPTEPVTAGAAASVMDEVNDFYVENSYNKTALISTISPLITVPQPKAYYGFAGPGTLQTDARAAVKAAGYDWQTYDLDVLCFTSVQGFDWGGLASVGGRGCWLQGSDLGLIAHELGHNYGLMHANFWDTRRDVLPPNPNNLPWDSDSLIGHDSVVGPGKDIEYGDIFDVMGSGGGSDRPSSQTVSSFTGHFGPVGKSVLGWLSESYITTVKTGGTNRIYAHDVPRVVDGRSYALRIRKDSQRDYWVSTRSRVQGNPSLQNGVQLHWNGWRQAVGVSDLLDVTPGTTDGRADSALALGRTFIDRAAEVYITPVAKSAGSGSSDSWFDVVVNIGPFASNTAPVVELDLPDIWMNIDVPIMRVNPGSSVSFSAKATDPEGDSVAYYWELGDGTYGPSAASVTKSWTAPGNYVVRCEVTDMKGGTTSKHFVVVVGNPTTARISGQVVDTLGNPVQGVRVHNGALTNTTEIGPDYCYAFTDSDGKFTIVGLAPAVYHVDAFLHGYDTKPRNFNGDVNVTSSDAYDVRFLASRQPIVTVASGGDAQKQPLKPGSFVLTRTGDTANTALRAFYVLSGTAKSPGDYKAPTNTVKQTNIIQGLLGPNPQVLDFGFVDFQTGVVVTNITITPASPPTNNQKTVTLSLVFPVQTIQIVDTNTNVIDHIGWQVVTVAGADRWFQTYEDYDLDSRAETTLQILEPAPTKPVISIVATDPITSEVSEDTGLFVLTRFGRTDQAVTIQLSAGGTATPEADYVAIPLSVTMAAGQTTLLLPVKAVPDLYLEGHETVVLTVKTDDAYSIGTASASVIIADNDLPTLTIEATDPIASETGLATGTVLLTRAGDMTRELTVTYLVSGSATAGVDYRVLPGRATIPAGQPSVAVTIVPRDNGVRDGGQTVEIDISDSPTYNVGFPNTATVFIQDKPLPVVTVAATIPGVVEPATAGEFTLTRAGDTTRELLVYYRMSGTAKPLADYAPPGSWAVIPAGASRVAIPVIPADDGFREVAETIILEVVPSSNYVVGYPYQATANLTDDDTGSLPAVGFNFLSSSASEGATQALVAVTVSATPGPDLPVTVDYKVTGGTAVAGVDYPLIVTGRVVFPPTDLTTLIMIPFFNNTNAQPNRTMVVTLFEPFNTYSNEVVTNDITITNTTGEVVNTNEVVTNIITIVTPMNGYLDAYRSHILTIVDDDAAEVSLEPLVSEAREEGSIPATMVLRRTGLTNRTQTVRLAISGTAASGSDYQALDSLYTIPIGLDSIEIPILPVDDPIQEYTETVTATIVDAFGARIGATNSVTIKILDNDGTIEFTSPAYSVGEGSGVGRIGVRRTGPSNTVASVDFSVTPGTATVGVDFLSTNGTLTFASGEVVQYFTVPIVDDNVVEPAKTINLTLSNPSFGGSLGGQDTAVLTIVDDDTMVEFTDSVYKVNENGTNATITLRRSGVLTNYASVDFAITNGTATNLLDFVATNVTVTFAPGQTAASVLVSIKDDNLAEGDETANMILSTNGVAQVSLSTNSVATLVIVDDECSIEFASPTYSVDEYAKVVTVGVNRLGGTVNPVTIEFSTVAGTAKAGTDFKAVSGTLAFAGDSYVRAADGSGALVFQPGETNKTFQVRIIDDTIGEGNEDFQAVLRNPKGPSQGAMQGSTKPGTVMTTVVTIVDNEVPGGIDYEFNPGSGTDGSVLALAMQEDGKVIIGGEFMKVDGATVPYIARLHEDGYLDSSFNPGAGASSTVAAVAVQPDGRILIGGDFTTVNTTNKARLARLNADGTLDASFGSGSGPDGMVNAIAQQTDGAVVLGGEFTGVDGVSSKGVARVLMDGSIDKTFKLGSGASGDVFALAIQPDGKILVGGLFSGIGTARHPNLERLNADGTPDSAFAPGTGPVGAVRSIALQSDGRILIAGEFTLVNNVQRAYLARLNADGSVDESFNPGTSPDAAVHAVGVQLDGKILVGGAFTNIAGADRNRFARLNPDGTIDSGFVMGAGANGAVRALVLQPNTALVIGGDFTMIKDVPRSHVARIHGDEKFVISTIQFASSQVDVAENAGTASLTVQRSGDLTVGATVSFLTVDGTAKGGSDYVSTNGTLTFKVGESLAAIKVAILDDTLAEGDESFSVVLTNLPSGYSRNAQLTTVVRILDNESAVAFSSATYSVNEGAGVGLITVRRTGASTNEVAVDYATLDGTAQAGLDYTNVTGTLTFASGVVEMTIEIPIIDDTLVENDETLSIVLSNPTGGAVLGSISEAVLTITDNDRVPFYSLNVTPPMGGSVMPASGPYPTGSTQTLIALAEADYEFVGWEGTTNSTQNPLSVVMDRNYLVVARFQPTSYTYTFELPFSSADLVNAPWSSSGNGQWEVQSSTVSAGRFALRSGVIGDGQQTMLSLTVDTRGGTGAFDMRVSSEVAADYLEFYLDGARIERWSGDRTWRTFQFVIPAGHHTLTWRYSKDNNATSGLDAAFIDNVYVPSATPDTTQVAARLSVVGKPDASTRIELRGKPGVTYVTQTSPDLAVWTSISTNMVITNPLTIEDVGSGGQVMRFYRAIKP